MMQSKRLRLAVLVGAAVVVAVILVWKLWSKSTSAAIGDAASDDKRTKLGAVDRLGKEGDDRARQVLGDLTTDPDGDVACRAVQTLGRAAKPEDLPVLKQAVKDPRPRVREAGVNAVGSLGSHTDPTVLVQALRTDPSPNVRAAAARWIGLLRYWEGMPDLINAMNDENLDVRRNAGASVRRLWERDFLYRADGPPEERALRVEFIRQSWEEYRRTPLFEKFRWQQKEDQP